MWWRSAQLLALLSLLGLPGCGFHPMYAFNAALPADAQISERLAQEQVATIDDRAGQMLRNALLDRFHSESAAVQPRYTLHVTVQKGMGGINFQKNATASGGVLNVTVLWQLLDHSRSKPVIGGTFNSVDSVNYLGPRYASVVAEQDAEKRSLNDLADLITDRIAVYLSSHRQ